MTDLHEIRSITNFLGRTTVETVLVVLSISVTTNQTRIDPCSLTDLFQFLAQCSNRIRTAHEFLTNPLHELWTLFLHFFVNFSAHFFSICFVFFDCVINRFFTFLKLGFKGCVCCFYLRLDFCFNAILLLNLLSNRTLVRILGIVSSFTICADTTSQTTFESKALT